jgi:hypothetical protein
LNFFADPIYANSIFIGFFIIICVCFWSDKNILSTTVILLGFWCISSLLFNLPYVIYTLIATYIISLSITFYCWGQFTAKINLVLIICSISAEFFWWYTGYPAPRIYSIVGVLSFIVLTRQLLFNRVFILCKYFDYRSGKVALDWQARKILWLDYVLNALFLIEYFIRHIAGTKDVMIMYNSEPYLTTFLSGALLAAIYVHYFYNRSQKSFIA